MKVVTKKMYWFTKEDNMVEKMHKAGYTYATLTSVLGFQQRSNVCDMFNGRRGVSQEIYNKFIELGFDLEVV